MKEHAAGLLSGFLLVCVLIGNTIFSVFTASVSPDAVAGTQQISLPVLTYHQVSEDKQSEYTVSAEQFAEDLAYLKSKGYTTISAEQLEDFLVYGTPLPYKPVMITFDGGYQSVYEQAYPVLQEYDSCAVVSVIGKYTDLYSYQSGDESDSARLSWEQLGVMVNSGVFEAANQSYELFAGDGGQTISVGQDFSEEPYRSLLEDDIETFNSVMKRELGSAPAVYSLSNEALSTAGKSVLASAGFRITLTEGQSVNLLTAESHRQGEVTIINRFQRNGYQDTKEAMSSVGIK